MKKPLLPVIKQKFEEAGNPLVNGIHATSYKAQCPFHKEKNNNTSFLVRSDSETFHCYGCHEGGTLKELDARLSL